MYTLTWHKSLKIGKTDLYTLDLYEWAQGEDILSLVPSALNALTTIENGIISDNLKGFKSIVGVRVTGLAQGVEVIKLEYTTATRSDSVTVNLIVGETCQNL